MQAEIALTLIGVLPDNVQVGQELKLTGVVTVHTITAEMVDVSTYDRKTYLPSVVAVGVYGNEMKFAATREP